MMLSKVASRRVVISSTIKRTFIGASSSLSSVINNTYDNDVEVIVPRCCSNGTLLKPLPSFSSTTYRFKSTAAAETVTATKADDVFVPSPSREYKFFENVEITPEGVAIIRIDCLGQKVNTISFAMADEAKEIFAKYSKDDKVKAVVVTSSKADNFIVGADIFDIKELSKKNPSDLLPIIKDGIEFFQSMKENTKLPVVCAIHGNCLGGGLEWAMWCDYRICTDSPKTMMGLPEVKLGLLPGFGGTQNLRELVGLQTAMDMMLTGKNVRPDKAKKLGLVDLVVGEPSLEKVAIDSAIQLANGTLKSKIKKKSIVNKLLEDTSFGRSFIWKEVEKLVKKNTRGNYPSPYAIIQCVKYGYEHPNKRFENEREQFAKLAGTKESKALIGIFEGMTALKKHDFNISKEEKEKMKKVTNVAVMGAGLMGAGIAQVSVQKGKYNVLLKDRDNESIARGMDTIQKDWKKKLSRKQLTQHQYNINSASVIPLTDESKSWEKHFNAADIIIEAVPEDLSLKKKIIAMVESVTPEHAVFATNTSAIPIKDIAEGAKRPQNIIGMHYFSPVPQMPLLEIIPHETTSEVAKSIAFDVGTKQGKTCIFVKDVPGFYVNRCLGPYMTEASALAKDGVSFEQMDTAILNFGMPVGPITLMDEVGIDVAFKTAKNLMAAEMGDRMGGGEIRILEDMVTRGYLGKKTSQGFYTYTDDKKKGKGKGKKIVSEEAKKYAKNYMQQDLKLNEKEIQDRMVCRFVNEAAKCLEDDIIESPVVGDIGLVFGTGFAPFRGGPFHYLDQVGVTDYVNMMNGLADKYGPQFEPCQLLKDHANTNKKFYP